MKHQFVYNRLLIFIFLVFCCSTIAISQQAINGFSFKNIDTKEFPKVNGELWVRDWNGINTSAVEFSEEQQANPIKPNFTGKTEATDSLAKNKCIVFLVLNPGISGFNELTWYRNVIKNAIKNGNIKKGDKIAVLNYNNEVGGQLLFPSGLTFTDDVKKLEQMVDNIMPRQASSLCQVGTSLLNQSINQTLGLLEGQFVKLPKGIIVLNDDNNCFGNDPLDRARKLDVSIYSIVYNKGGVFNTSRELCKTTYGIYFSDPSRDLNNSTNKLNDYLKKFLQRQAGLNYKFNYESKYEKDGKPHTLSMNYNGAQTITRMDVPNKNILEWVVANPIGAAVIFLFLVLVSVLISLQVSKIKKQRQMEKMMEQQRLMEVDRKHKENEDMLSAKLSSQQQELDAIKRKEAALREQEMKKKTQEEEKKKEAELIAQMKLNGNYAWFDYTTGDGIRNRFEIRQPVIVVGRDASCQLCVELPTVSKKHLQLNYTANNEYWIKDLGSSNGLYINGQRVQQSKLKHGDFIQAGELVLNFFI
jgi:hypothetical protein